MSLKADKTLILFLDLFLAKVLLNLANNYLQRWKSRDLSLLLQDKSLALGKEIENQLQVKSFLKASKQRICFQVKLQEVAEEPVFNDQMV